MNSKKLISAAFPYEPNFQEVIGSKMHYVDEGDKNSKHTFLLLHGNPTSSYLWRNIIPHLQPLGRVVAPDLIGMGKSGKPDIEYTLKDHISYLDAFIENLGLKDIVLVIQDWGSGLGFNYANQHRDNVVGIAFFEALVQVSTWAGFNESMKPTFQAFRDPDKGPELLVKNNVMIEQMLPAMAGRKLTEEEMEQYRAPYLKEEHRKPLLMWPSQISIDGTPEFTTDIVNAYQKYHSSSDTPKLFFYAKPGAIIGLELAQKVIDTWNNVKAINVGQGSHFLQESHPHEIGEGIFEWYKDIFS